MTLFIKRPSMCGHNNARDAENPPRKRAQARCLRAVKMQYVRFPCLDDSKKFVEGTPFF
jgi:hypothetical protein